MANTGPARPPYGDVAGLRQLKQTLVFFIPSDGDAATCEGDLRSLARRSRWRVGWAHRCIGYAWSHGFTRAKNFQVHAVGGDAPRRKTNSQVMKECGWSAQIEVCIARHTKFVEHRYVEVSSGVKFPTQTIVGAGPAVEYSTAAVWQLLHQAA